MEGTSSLQDVLLRCREEKETDEGFSFPVSSCDPHFQSVLLCLEHNHSAPRSYEMIHVRSQPTCVGRA